MNYLYIRLVIVIIIIITIICILIYFNIYANSEIDRHDSKINHQSNERNKSELYQTSKLEPHQFITLERTGLIVHYMSYDDHKLINSSSNLKIWYFNKFSIERYPNVMLFLMNHDNIIIYEWLIQLCKNIETNLAMIYVHTDSINQLKLTNSWSKDRLMLASDSNSIKIREFILLHYGNSDSKTKYDDMISTNISGNENINDYYKAIILINDEILSDMEDLERFTKDMFIISSYKYYDESSYNGNARLYNADWSSSSRMADAFNDIIAKLSN